MDGNTGICSTSSIIPSFFISSILWMVPSSKVFKLNALHVCMSFRQEKNLCAINKITHICAHPFENMELQIQCLQSTRLITNKSNIQVEIHDWKMKVKVRQSYNKFPINIYQTLHLCLHIQHQKSKSNSSSFLTYISGVNRLASHQLR